MRRTLIALALTATATSAVAEQPEEPAPRELPAEVAEALETMARSTADLRRSADIMRSKLRGEGAACADDPACADGWASSMAAAATTRQLQREAEQGRIVDAVAWAEASAFQAAYAYDAWMDVYGESGVAQACVAAGQAGRALNAAMVVIEAGCDEVSSQTCADYPEAGLPRVIIPECAAPQDDRRPNDGPFPR